MPRMALGQSKRLFSPPVQRRSSRKIGPVPAPNAARPTAMASARVGGREGGREGEDVYNCLGNLTRNINILVASLVLNLPSPVLFLKQGWGVLTGNKVNML